jgi:hypothetical protein
MSTQDFAVEHARQHDVVGKLRLASALRARVNLAERFADDAEWLTVISVLSHNDLIKQAAD